MPTSKNENTKETKEGGEQEAPPKKTNKMISTMKQVWAKIELDLPTVLMMVKASIPPTIAIAMYQAKSVADTYTTLGYLVAVTSILGLAIMPRAKFVQTMTINVIAICLATAFSLLALWSAIQARLHTTPEGVIPAAYNSSASAVAAIWLFFLIYLVSAIRSARPALQFPGILFTIFLNVSMTNGPVLPTMAMVVSFIERVLYAFLTGFGLATGVSLFFIPVTQRSIVFKELTGYMQSLRGAMKAQRSYIISLEQNDMFRGGAKAANDGLSDDQGTNETKEAQTQSSNQPPEANAVKAEIEKLKGLHAKLGADLTLAKREMAYGKLLPNDLSEIFRLIRAIMLPLLGMSSMVDIFDRTAHVRGWDKHEPDESERKEVAEWQDIIKSLHEPLDEIAGAIDKGLEHALVRLELIKPRKNTDEAPSQNAQPGTNEFAAWLDRKSRDFYESRETTLKTWFEGKEFPPSKSIDGKMDWPPGTSTEMPAGATRNQRQLYMVLYIEHLLYATSRATFDLVAYSDSKVSDGTMARMRIVFPSYRRLKKWVNAVFANDEDTNTNAYVSSMDGLENIYLGEAFKDRKDPEHLPPRSLFEKIGNVIRVIPHLLRSEHSVLGFRTACATFSIAIVAYLKDSYLFFTQQRLVWAMIMVAISMTRTSGQSTFNFLLRIGGTIAAMVASYLIYYIPDGHTAGIIVFLFIWEFMCFYVVLKMPRFIVVGIISAVTAILIVGYELQVRILGVATSATSGQEVLGINVLAPYRLATVAGGLAVAWIWTIFPFPMTEHSEMRRDVGAALYLLANFYAIVHETFGARVRGDDGDPTKKNSPGAKLDKARLKVFSKELFLLQKIKASSKLSRWDFSIGGRFPKEEYDLLVRCAEGVLSYSALIAYSSKTFGSEGEATTEWQRDFRRLLVSVGTTSHEITTRLCLLSSAVSSGSPLPPYLQELKPYTLTEQLNAIDADILSVRHVSEPGYAAFAVVQIAGRIIVADINTLTAHVKTLVGELDFSFHTVDTSSKLREPV